MATILRPWQVLDHRKVFSAPPYVSVSLERIRLPDGRCVDDFYQVALDDFACVYAEDDSGRTIMLRQYKHGVRGVTLTCPSGGLAPGERPLDTAKRELLEETGCDAAEWSSLGAYVVDANKGVATAHLFHARGCRSVAAPRLVDLEETEIVHLTRAEMVTAVAAGEITVLPQITLIGLVWQPDLRNAVVRNA